MTYTTTFTVHTGNLRVLSPLNSLRLRFIGTLQADTALLLASHVADASIWIWTQTVTVRQHSPWRDPKAYSDYGLQKLDRVLQPGFISLPVQSAE